MENELPSGFNLVTPRDFPSNIEHEIELEGEGADKIYLIQLFDCDATEVLNGNSAFLTIPANTLVNYGETYTIKAYLETSTGYGYDEYDFTSTHPGVTAGTLDISAENIDLGYLDQNMVIDAIGFVDGADEELTYQYYYDIGDGYILLGENTLASITSPFPGASSIGTILIKVTATNIYLCINETSTNFDIGVMILFQDYSSTVLVSESLLIDASQSQKGTLIQLCHFSRHFAAFI